MRSGFCPEGPLQKEIASSAVRDFCSLLFKELGFLDQPLLIGFLVIGMMLLHGAAPFDRERNRRSHNR